MEKKLWIAIAVVALLLVVAVIALFSMNWNESIGICYRGNTDPSNSAYRQALEQALAQQGYQVLVTNADTDQARQLEQIEELADRRCKALIVEPVMVTAGEELLKALEKTDVPAILINRALDGQLLEAYPQITCMGMDASEPGKIHGQMALSLPDGGDINGDGIVSYMMLQGPEGYQDGALMTQGFDGAVAQGGLTAEVLSVGYCDWTMDGGYQVCSQLLTAYGKDIEVVLCCNGQMTLGAVKAVADAGRKTGEDIYLYGLGVDNLMAQLIQQGSITGTVYNDTQAQAMAAAEAVLSKLSGKQIAPYAASYQAITAENAGEYVTEE